MCFYSDGAQKGQQIMKSEDGRYLVNGSNSLAPATPADTTPASSLTGMKPVYEPMERSANRSIFGTRSLLGMKP